MVIEHMFARVSRDPGHMSDADLDSGLRACAKGRSYFDAREAALLAEVRRRKNASGAGVVDTSRILKDTAGVSGREARKRAKLSEELERLPRVADSLANGDLNIEQAALVADTHAELPKETEVAEAELVDLAAETPPDRLRHQLQAWRNQQRPDDGETDFDRTHRKRKASFFDTDDGLAAMFTQHNPLEGDEVRKAVEFHANRLWRQQRNSDVDLPIPRSKRPQLFADAVVEMARLSMNPTEANSAAPPHASVVAVISIEWLLGHLDVPGFSELADGRPIPVTVVRQLAARVGIIPMVMDTDGAILDMGRRSRTATDDQRLALVVRDGACAFPDCDSADPAFTHAHHVREWSDGGGTDLENLANTCMSDHHRLHDQGWTANRHEDHTWWLHRADVTPHKTLRRRRPPPEPDG